MARYFAFLCGCHGQQVITSERTKGYVHRDGSKATQVRSVCTGDDRAEPAKEQPSRPA